jgi:uncharacterized membrane protein (UPF0127 family)
MKVPFDYVSKSLCIFTGFVLFGSVLISCGGKVSPEDASQEADETAVVIEFREDGRLSIARDGEAYVNLAIEIAENDSTRMRGMMQRQSMPDDSGMLFIFETEEDRAFWMANTPLPLDLIFVSADSMIISIKKYVQPLSAQNVPSEGPAQFVLEVIAGYSDSKGIIEGDKLSWVRKSTTPLQN